MKKLIVIGLLFFIFLPVLQTKFTIVKERRLYGVEVVKNPPVFSIDSFRDSSFQKQFNDYFKQVIGFRSFFVIGYNQLLYSFFNKTPDNQTVAIGKRGQLFKKDYIREYYSGNNVKPELFVHFIEELILLQKELEKRDIFLFFFITPNKVSIYPDLLPVNWVRPLSERNRNYKTLKTYFIKHGVSFVDGISIMRGTAESSEMGLFCKTGHHWNKYGAYIAASALIEHISSKTGYDYSSFGHSSVTMFTDYDDAIAVRKMFHNHDHDLSRLLNIFFPPYSAEVPKVSFKTQGKRQANVLIVGDSFNYMIAELFTNAALFESLELYYYNNTSVTYPQQTRIPIDKNMTVENVLKKDIVILSLAEVRLPYGDFKFVSDILNDLSL